MRPKKKRFVACCEGERHFRPLCRSGEDLESVKLDLDELEVMRLSHLESLDQTEIAERMCLHQSTVSRILTTGHKKVTDALVNIKGIQVRKACCHIITDGGGDE